MEQQLLIGGLVLAIPVFITIYKFIESSTEKRVNETNKLRQAQTDAIHQQTLATKDLTHEMKMMRREVTDLENRTHNLEVVVFKKDRM
jgi:hypothetical protein